MQTKPTVSGRPFMQLLRECPLPGDAPFEIHGASARGCEPHGDYLYSGFRYLLDDERDVLVREDVIAWLDAHRHATN